MAFIKVTDLTASVPVSPDQFPVFLFPDVTGDSLGLRQLAQHLQTARDNKCQIYLWHDPEPSEQGGSLSAYAEMIKNEIIKLYPLGPCFLGGYSFGGSLANVVAQKLTAAQREVSLFIIDTPSIKASQLYLQTQNGAATQDLVSMLNYAASLVSHYTHQNLEKLSLTDKELNDLRIKSIEEQLQILKNRLISDAPRNERLRSMLEQYFAVVTQNLSSLLHHKNDVPSSRLPKIGLCLSEESQHKYDFNMAKSWETYCDESEFTQIPGSSHLSLLTNKDHCREVAMTMAVYFKNYFSAQEVATTFFKAWFEKHPELNLYRLFHELEKSQLAKEVKPDLSNYDASPTNSPHRSPLREAQASSSSMPAPNLSPVQPSLASTDSPPLSPLFSPEDSPNLSSLPSRTKSCNLQLPPLNLANDQTPSISSSSSPDISPTLTGLTSEIKDIDMQLTPKERGGKSRHCSQRLFTLSTMTTRNREQKQEAVLFGTVHKH